MTRDQAITELNTFKIGAKSELGETALDMAIKVLEQEPCEDAISRQSMLDYIKYLHGEMPEEEFVKALPSVTPTRKKGKWLNKDASGYHFYGKCSECGQEFCVDAWYTQNMKFCSNCGAEMESE